jgi:hypothetical protein
MERNLDNLSFRFFKMFARYESTLKERGFFRASHGRIDVDWDRFANEVAGPNYKQTLGDINAAVEYILQEPPMRQTTNDEGNIIWVEVPNVDQSPQALFGHICRMRNNLYHGAKFNGSWFDPERSKALLQCGLAVLEHYRAWLELKPMRARSRSESGSRDRS